MTPTSTIWNRLPGEPIELIEKNKNIMFRTLSQQIGQVFDSDCNYRCDLPDRHYLFPNAGFFGDDHENLSGTGGFYLEFS